MDTTERDGREVVQSTALRDLEPAPHAAVDAAGTVRVGSFRGSMRHVDFSAHPRSRLRRVAGEKRWVYVALATERLFVAVAVVRMGYASKLFAFAYDADRRAMLADVSRMAPPFSAAIGESALVSDVATYRFAGDHARFTTDTGGHRLVVRAGSLRVDARLSGEAPPALSSVVRIGRSGDPHATEKRALMPLDGEIHVGGARLPLANGFGGYDYSSGFPGRHTTWRWAFGMGLDAAGEPLGFNLVEGFVGAPECAVWHRGEVHGLPEGRFTKDAPMEPWSVVTEGREAELAFAPGALHDEHVNLGLLRSTFIQPVGAYSGAFRLGGGEVRIGRMLGVAEDQDVFW